MTEVFDSKPIEGHEVFRWENIQADPKAKHPTVQLRDDWYKTMQYEVLDNNGFLYLYTLRGRVYWVSQNLTTHTTADWKLHCSVIAEDIPKAWNILSKIFMESKCEIGMKATTTGETFTKSTQRGRELTLYIYQYDERLRSGIMYEQSPITGHDLFIGDPLKEEEADFYLGPEWQGVYDANFWYDLIAKIESAFKAAGIRCNGGTADGDLPLPHCQYVSLRNEAFVIEDKEKGLQYPSNSVGWNAAKHKNPLEETIYMLLLKPVTQT